MDKEIVTAEPFLLLAKTPWFRPRNAPSACRGDSEADVFTKFWLAFIHPFKVSAGFMPCTGQNYLIRVILIKSGLFDQGDITLKLQPMNLFIHQYLEVKIEDTHLTIDPWAKFLGVPFGQVTPSIGWR